ncbi:MAG: glycosyltransferase [Candidatus Omnitrophota bacterium]|jgi:glycosyltransferase involved in cell wall biosynthesis
MVKPKKKILFVLQDLTLGGAEQLKFIVEKHINKNDYSVTYCCIKKRGTIGDKIIKRGGDVIVFNLSDKFYNLIATYRLYRLVKSLKPDLIHSALFNANFHARLAGMLTKIPVITEEHGMYTWKRWYHIAIDIWLAKYTCKIIVPSNSVKEFIVTQEGIGFDKIEVIYNCIDPNALRSNVTRIEARKSLGLSADDFVVGVVGNLRKEKGHSVLLKAFEEVLNIHKNAKLLIAGYGPLDKQLKELSKELGVGEQVVFMGKVINIADFLKSLDLFVMPSLNEGFGIALIEAVYMNVPCIASDIGGIREIAKEFPSITLVAPNNAKALSITIIEAIASKNNCAAPSTKTNMIRSFTPEFYIDQLEKLYENNINIIY